MNRQEFIDKLQEALAGEISAGDLQSNLAYYRDYISSEISRGRTEEEVMAELGDPRLIARTIIDAQTAEEESHGYYREERTGTGSGAGYGYYREEQSGPGYEYYREERTGPAPDYGYDNAQNTREDTGRNAGGFFRRFFGPRDEMERSSRGPLILTGWKGTLAIALIVIVVLVIFSTLFTVAVRILLSPVFWIALMLWMLWRTLSGGGRNHGGW